MDQFVTNFLLFFGALWFLVFSAFAVISHFEGEFRARKIGIATALLGGIIFLFMAALPMPVRWAFFGVVIISGLVGIVFFFLPVS